MQLKNNCWVVEIVVKEDIALPISQILAQMQHNAFTKIEFSGGFSSLIKLQLINITSIAVTSVPILESLFYGFRFCKMKCF